VSAGDDLIGEGRLTFMRAQKRSILIGERQVGGMADGVA
jgi:hypothetical protein